MIENISTTKSLLEIKILIRFSLITRTLSCFLLSALFCINAINAQEKMDSFLQLKGADRWYELIHLYGRNFTDKKFITSLNYLIEEKGNESDKLVKYFWIEKKAHLLQLQYTPPAIPIYKALVVKAEEIPNYYLVADYHISMGVIYNSLKEYNKAFESQLYCLEALKKDPDGKYFQQSWWLHIIAEKYYQFQDYEKAIELSKIASTLSFKYTPDGVWFQKANTNLLAMAYLKNKNYDSATIWLQKTLQIAHTLKDTAWMGIATGNLATIQYLKGNYQQAIDKYLQGLKWCRNNNIWDNIASFCNFLADCYLKTGKIHLVEPLLTESQKANRKDFNNTAFLFNHSKLFDVAKSYYQKTGNLPLVVQYSDSLSKYEKLYYNYFDLNKKIKAEAEFSIQQTNLQNQLLITEGRLQRQALFVVAIAFLLALLVAILYFKRINLQRKLVELNKSRVEQQLVFAKKDLKQFTNSLIEKNKLIEHFTLEIGNLKNQVESSHHQQLATLQQLKTSTILTSEDWLKFKELFEKIHPQFFSTLKSQYPHLTQAEVRFLAFIKLEISPKEMASLLGVGDEAIRTLRFRLKKKLSITQTKDIEQIIDKL